MHREGNDCEHHPPDKELKKANILTSGQYLPLVPSAFASAPTMFSAFEHKPLHLDFLAICFY
jgi:hypothetical protein